MSQPGFGQEAALGPARGLCLEEPVEEVDIAQGVLGGLLADGVEQLRDPLQLEPLEVSQHPLIGEVHESPS
jgi:hypothetical protein